MTELPLPITAAFSAANMSISAFGGWYARKSRCMSNARSNDYSPRRCEPAVLLMMLFQ